MAETQNIPQRDRPPQTERLLGSNYMVGFQARLVLGGSALNPARKDLEAVTREGLTRPIDLTPLEKASKRERKDFWEGKENNDFERQKEAWIQNTTQTFQNAQDFFANSPRGKAWAGVYTNLGINTENFTEKNARNIYRHYFEENKEKPVEKFVGDVIGQYRTPQGDLNLDKLQQALPAIRWLGNIFGRNASEVIEQVINIEIRRAGDPDGFVAAVNEKQTVSDQEVLRLNIINSDEQRLLTYLWTSGEAHVTTVQPSGAYRRTYERLKSPREYPREQLLHDITNPLIIAKRLKAKLPQKYGQIDAQELAAEIEAEAKIHQQWMNSIDLSQDYLLGVIEKTLNHFEGFVKDRYGITLPDIKSLRIIPLHGKSKEAYGAGEGTLAFVSPEFPAIFLDFENLARFAKTMGQADPRQMSRDQIGILMERLLREVNPHEYTHLTADTTFWRLLKATPQGEQLIDVKPGRIGMYVNKVVPPIIDQDEQLTMKERGRQLMEAVTVELTNQWAKSFNASLDIPAYPQERRVLHSLINMISQEKGLSQDDAFKIFVDAYFKQHDLRRLNEALSGAGKSEEGKRSRPYFMQELYAIMEFEEAIASQHRQQSNYVLTHAFIQNGADIKQFSAQQKAAIRELVQLSLLQEPKVPFYLSPPAQEHLAGQLGLKIPRTHQQPRQQAA